MNGRDLAPSGETRRLTNVKMPGDLFFQNDVSSGTEPAIIPSHCKYGFRTEIIRAPKARAKDC